MHVTQIKKGVKQLHLVFEVKSQKESFLVMMEIQNKNGEKNHQTCVFTKG